MSMISQRITISLPTYLLENLTRLTDKRGRSRFIAKAIESQLLKEKLTNPTKEFLALRKKLPKFSQRKIVTAIDKGR